MILSTAERLYAEGKIKSRIKSGGDWNKNGIFVFKDKAENFIDLPHIEIV